MHNSPKCLTRPNVPAYLLQTWGLRCSHRPLARLAVEGGGRRQLIAANTKFLQALRAQWLQSRLHCTDDTARELARLIFGEAQQ